MRETRRQRRVEQTRVEILAAAARAFADKGLDGATMQQIARESGYTAASLYAYFPGKLAIVEGLLGLFQRELLETFDMPLPVGLTFAQSLELLTRRQLELAERRREAMAVFIECAAASRSQRSGRDQAGFELYVPRLAAWLSRMAGPGDLGGLGAEEAATFFAGLSHGFFHRWLRGKDPLTRPSHAQLLVQLFLHGVLGVPPAARATRKTGSARRRSP
jgi:AcrR family transcriptional regulator